MKHMRKKGERTESFVIFGLFLYLVKRSVTEKSKGDFFFKVYGTHKLVSLF